VSNPLPGSFYDRDVVQVARDLLCKRLVRASEQGTTVGRIVEVEAYLPRDDPANHAYRGRTRRNASMFGPPGHAYVYAIHARFCLNVVTEPEGVPSAVLIRALEPLEGLELMRERRSGPRFRAAARRADERLFTSGPARLCEALAVDRALDGWDLTIGERLWLEHDPHPSAPREIVTARRVGVTSARDRPLRFYVADNLFVSKRAHAKSERTARRCAR
jgi:DNA-3-methyladenine glycosylase